MRHPYACAFWLKVALLLILASSNIAARATIYVDGAKGVDTNPGTAAKPVQDIATAIALAQKVETIVVANGFYTGPKNQNLDTAGKAVVIRSVGGAANCIIDGHGQAQVFLIHSGETSGTQIIGFTIQNCHAPDGAYGWDGGSGGAIDIENSSPTIQQCILAYNSTGNGGDGDVASGGQGGDGGAIFIHGGSPLVINCQFLFNTTGNGGAGASQVLLDGGYGGGGGSGGALKVDAGSPVIANCLFVFNRTGNGGDGGDSDPDLAGISGAGGNGGDGGNGGAIACSSSDVSTIINCTVIANQTGHGGIGGVSTGYQGINGHSGGSGSGGGLADNSSTTAITNSILFRNAGNDLDGGIVSYSDVAVSANAKDGGHNVHFAPRFVRNPGTMSNTDTGDLHLTLTSPCLNAGNSAAPALPTVDLDLEPRVQRGGVDLGVYELVNSTPTLTKLSFTTVPVGITAFMLTLIGTNFNQTSMVLWNGAPRACHYGSVTILTVPVTATDLASPATIKINVFNPGHGGGTSETLTLTVTNPRPTLTQLSPAIVPVGSAAFTLTLTGAHFNQTSVALWNGTKRASAYVSATTLTVGVAASDIAAAGLMQIMVNNPGPGGGSSNVLLLQVAVPKLTLSAGALTRDAKSGVITVPAVFTNTGAVTAGKVTVTAATLGAAATGTRLPISLGNLVAGEKATTALTFPGTVGKKGQTTVLTITTSFTGGSWAGKLTVTLP